MSDRESMPVFQVVFAYRRSIDDFVVEGVYTEPEKALEHLAKLRQPTDGSAPNFSSGVAEMDFPMVAKQFIAGFLSMVGRHSSGSHEDIVFTLSRRGGVDVRTKS